MNASLPRRAALDRHVRALRSYVVDRLSEPQLGDQERAVVRQALIGSGEISAALRVAEGAPALLQVEHDSIRPLVHSVREHALRRHLLLARPVWGAELVQVEASAIACVGGTRLQEAVGQLCEERRLTLLAGSPQLDPGLELWTRLRRAVLAVIDLTGERGRRGRECYALGLALALGRPALIVARELDLPFDVDAIPFVWRDPAAQAELGQALDDALYRLPRTDGRSSLTWAISCFRRLMEERGNRGALGVLADLPPGGELDPFLVLGVIRQLLRLAGEGERLCLHSTWAVASDEPQRPACFHVMPFAPEFDGAREAVRAACARTGLRYVRADESTPARILRALWSDLASASHVIVDLSGLNENVCLELGMRHAVGGSTLLVTHGQLGRAPFEEIKTLRRTSYEPRSLAGIAERFLASPAG